MATYQYKREPLTNENADRLANACLARVFEVYPLTCPRCGLEMKPVAVILNDKELVRLLTHLGLAGGIPGIPAGRAAVAV